MYFSQVLWQPTNRSGQPLHGACNPKSLLDAVGHSSDRTGVPHSFQKFLLIRARVFARKFHFDVDSSSIRDTVAHDVGFAMMTDVHDAAVLRIELPDRVVTSDTSVLTESHDDLVL